MNTANAILGAIDLWLRQQGYNSYLNLSHRRGSPSYAGTPNISLPANKMYLRIEGDKLKLGYSPSELMGEKGTRLLELSDPGLFDQLATHLGDPDAHNTTGQDQVVGGQALP